MKKCTSIIILVAIASVAFAMDLPPTPTGFTWKEIPEIKAAFLVPKGWYFKREATDKTLAYFITKENINETGSFSTGLTINVFRHLASEPAVSYAKKYIGRLAADKNVEMWTRDFGPFRGFACRFKDNANGGIIVMHTLMVANPKTNTLYMFIFESPEPEWPTTSKTGEKIMQLLAIDDEI
jgi:hypothetical protein